ncbi:hypothetical protein BKA93DRAFT_579398 [Sparassis latifolia]
MEHDSVRSPRFPVEVCEIFIDHLHDDFSLSSCALVCRSWVHSSQYHLFHTLRIQARNEGFIPFQEFITGKPHIARHIRHLRLAAPHDASAVDLDGRPLTPPLRESREVDSQLIYDIVSHLHNISSLTLSEVKFSRSVYSRHVRHLCTFLGHRYTKTELYWILRETHRPDYVCHPEVCSPRDVVAHESVLPHTAAGAEIHTHAVQHF